MSRMPRGVCLTADVHNASARGREQRILPGTEMGSLAEYLNIAHSYGIPVTAFVSGKAVLAEPELTCDLVHRYRVELGGHWFDAFPWLVPYQVLGRATGLRRGPSWWQARDIRRTVAAIRQGTGVRIRAWRDHAYRHDRNTYGLLARLGIAAVSDDVSLDRAGPARTEEGIVSVPINVLPDHESIRHLPPTTGGGQHQMSPEEWVSTATAQVADIIARGGVATVLAHPACMKVADGFSAFTRLCAALARYPSLTFADLYAAEGRQEEGLPADAPPAP